jgi:hypothetical protein
MNEKRDLAITRIESELFGPAGGADEVVTGRPYWRYLSGTLFPQAAAAEALQEDDEQDGQGSSGDDAHSDTSVAMAYDALPSSMGISFYVSGAKRIEVLVEGARYVPIESSRDKWRREALGTTANPTVGGFAVPAAGRRDSSECSLWDGRAKLSALFRPCGAGHLVTISLVNAQAAGGAPPAQQVQQMLFQCRFRAACSSGQIGEYPTVARRARHEEDDEMRLAYRRRKTYGIGHGCAATWDEEKFPVNTIAATPLPSYQVYGLTTEIELGEGARRSLRIQWLADQRTPRADLCESLSELVAAYRGWIARQHVDAESLEADQKKPARRMVARQFAAADRMAAGIAVLRDGDPRVLKAFRIAQEAMLRQFMWVSRRTSPQAVDGKRVKPVDPWGAEGAKPGWRPFQLAFQLVVLESLVNEDSEDRDTLDLLWFPTGGGKTEAYFALAAFEIALRRLRHGEAGAGTRVIMRYTLRLLTSQQFERAATLICVMEQMRCGQADLGLGDSPISLGLWVGGATTPNWLDHDVEANPGALQLFQRVLEDTSPENPFQLGICPFCSTRIIPSTKSRREHYGIEVTSTTFRMFCPEKSCPLHGGIPVHIVDEDLFRRPPTFLIGTIDKFARMAWDAGSATFFGGDGTLAPSLIIQDELHLITGPLGTIAGIYEAGIDTVLARRGMRPKYLAATATIQRAREQCRSLYAREAKLFPPPGLDAGDSFFSVEDRATPGRVFIGAMGHGMYSSLTSLIQVSAAAATLPDSFGIADTVARDSYWTQVIYHNSRQELGKTTTMLRDDVKTRLQVLQPDEARRRDFDSVEELSANLKGSQISKALERLRVEWPATDAIDVVACTNMISVGVDVGRLGLMIVKGQPKATSEYIQASSRIGRDKSRLPGIVIALYGAARPRDRSHYETFQSYHSAFYRVVEPASVTPYSAPARERALHAALIIVLRHLLRWVEPRDAGAFDRMQPAQSQAIDALRQRLMRACRADETTEVLDHLERLLSQWETWRDEPGSPLSFSAEPQFKSLITQFPTGANTSPDGWPTLNSMRHVDGEVGIRVEN